MFEERIKMMIGDAKKLFQATQEWKSIRANILKIDSEKLYERLKEKFDIKRIPWYENGFFVKGEIAKSIEYYLGYYHIQEASSMLPPLVIEAEKNDRIVDLCAAPGSKTTQMAMHMENGGIIIANDVNIKRIRALVHNIQKSGVMNCIVTNYDGRYFWKSGFKANKILLDAPCTASGKIIKNKKIIEKWNYKRILKMSRLQKKLMEGAYRCLEKGGTIVYSTCSLEPEENEEVIDYAVNSFNLEMERIDIKGIKIRRGIKEWNGRKYEDMDKVIRIWPHDNLTEGFFICKLRKY